ncbi:MAG: SdpI family protein [Clostridiaceae bacterium]|nr:SdpI family protein [Eubacteriales bacterium]
MKTKNNHVVMILSSVVCLLPIILSLVVYNELPEKIAIHWDVTGSPDNYASKAFAALGLPLLFMIINIYVNFHLHNAPKRANASTAVIAITSWFCPFLSLILTPIILFVAMGAAIPISLMASVLMGISLILFGNYLPKNRQNYVIGIKLPWTLDNADNWNKTHRMASRLWIFGGIVFLIGSFLFPGSLVWSILSLAIIALLIIAPRLYSYSLYKRHGEREDND